MNKRSSQTQVLYALSGFAIFAVYCLTVFLVVDIKEPNVFWMSFGFMCLAFLVLATSSLFVAGRQPLETKFFGVPTASLGVFYFFAELFASVVFMLFQHVNWKAALLVQVVLAVVLIVAVILSFTIQSSVQKASAERRDEAVTFKAQFVDIEALAGRCSDAGLQKKLKHLAETIRYSDPFGKAHPILQEIEARIQQQVMDLQLLCESDDTERASKAVDDLERLYLERRSKLLLVK